MSSTLDVVRILRAARYSLSGLRAAARHDAAIRQELILGVALAPAAVWLGETGLERAALLASLLLVLIVELLNSAVETAIDRTGTDPNTLSGRAKDLGSAAVLVSLVNVPVVWGFVLLG